MHTSMVVRLEQNKRLNKKSIWINGLTCCRIPLTIICMIGLSQYHQSNSWSCLVVVYLCSACVYLTDYFDGKLARKYNVTSKAGAQFDLFCDSFYIILCSVTMNKIGLLPICITFLILYKLIEFHVISNIVRKRNRSEQHYYYDFLGRILISIFYATPCILTTFYLFTVQYYDYVVIYYTITIVLLTAVSSILKIYNVYKKLTMII